VNVGYDVLSPFVAYGVEAGMRYSDPAAVEERRRSSPISAQRCRASRSARESRSTGWGTGATMDASSRALRSIRRSSGENNGLN
jgi:hypothetical protein